VPALLSLALVLELFLQTQALALPPSALVVQLQALVLLLSALVLVLQTHAQALPPSASVLEMVLTTELAWRQVSCEKADCGSSQLSDEWT